MQHAPRALELDLYCEAEALAIEFQGRQHYEVVARFHKEGERSLHGQQQRDQRKRLLCAQRGVDLIEVPHWVADVHGFLSGHPLVRKRLAPASV